MTCVYYMCVLHSYISSTSGPVVQSLQPGVELAQNCGDDSGLQEEPPITAPPHHTTQHCVCCGILQVSGFHNLPEPEVGAKHKYSPQKGPAEDVLPAPAQAFCVCLFHFI